MSTTPPPATVTTTGEHETAALAETLARRLDPGDVVALTGELGAGKTRFVRGLARGLGHDPSEVSSPTFVLAHEHASPGARCPLVHVDAYRLSPEDDDTALDLDAAVRDAVVVIEWADRLESSPLEPALRVNIRHLGPEERSVTLRAAPGREDLLAHLAPAAHACRSCGAPIDESADTFPFCSPRCRGADLNQWFGESYRVSRPIEQADLETND